jgi:hypothetical protein
MSEPTAEIFFKKKEIKKIWNVTVEPPSQRQCSVCCRQDVAMVAGLSAVHKRKKGGGGGGGHALSESVIVMPEWMGRMWKAFLCGTCWQVGYEVVCGLKLLVYEALSY